MTKKKLLSWSYRVIYVCVLGFRRRKKIWCHLCIRWKTLPEWLVFENEFFLKCVWNFVQFWNREWVVKNPWNTWYGKEFFIQVFCCHILWGGGGGYKIDRGFRSEIFLDTDEGSIYTSSTMEHQTFQMREFVCCPHLNYYPEIWIPTCSLFLQLLV